MGARHRRAGRPWQPHRGVLVAWDQLLNQGRASGHGDMDRMNMTMTASRAITTAASFSHARRGAAEV